MLPINSNNGLKHILTPTMIDNLIEKTELSIREEKIKQSELDDDLKAAKEMYDQVKGKYDNYQAKIDEENDILEVLVRYKTNASVHKKDIKVYSHISNIKQKPNKKKTIKWLPHVIRVLKDKNRFMTGYEMVQEAILSSKELFDMKLEGKFIKKTGYYFDHQARCNKGGMRMHNDLIGLLEWFNFTPDVKGMPDFQLKIEYLKQFMG